MISLVFGMIEEHKAFNKMCDSLPKEDAERLKEARRARHRDELEHIRALEIANASRARNFWGN
jgi:hypothetical protein